MLTKKQHELLMFINQRLGEGGVSPSFDEMKEALNLRSKSGIHRLITALEERGFIRRLPHRARALEVVKLPEASAEGRKAAKPAPEPVAAARSSDSTAPRPATVQLPLYGRIAAGLPIEAMADPSTLIDVPAGLIANGEHYALEVEGDSMVEAGIMDGDTVVIQRCEGAENGAIVVALVDDHEVTLKTLRKKQGLVALEAANPNYPTREYPAGRVRVQGRLVGLMRRY
ncbi:MAG TPA: transcriptional repressor LexA [Alphaproteobacteria bacterium]|nr:transcriptional repressor LexA [Alphaproteobacteria bacterium]